MSDLITKEGLTLTHNPKNAFAVLTLHYSCDEDKNPNTPQGQAWIREIRKGKGQNEWNREYEIDFLSHVGKRVCPDFDEARHVDKNLGPVADVRLNRGWDPGIRASACVVGQIIETPGDLPQVRVFREYPFFEASFQKLVKAVLDDCTKHYEGHQFWDDIDVAALQRGQAKGAAPIDILGQLGVAARHQKSRPHDRAVLLNHLLTSRRKDGTQCFLIHPRCHRLISGARGLYRFKESKEGRATDKIDDTEVVHLFDALGYFVYNNLYLHFKQKPTVKQVKEKVSIWLQEVVNPQKSKKTWQNC